MKYSILTLLFLIVFTGFGSTHLLAQEADSLLIGFNGFKNEKIPFKGNVIKFSPIPLLVGQIPYCGELRLTYERLITHNTSFSIGGSYNFPSVIFAIASRGSGVNINQFSFRGGRAILGFRYYPLKRKKAPAGLFFGPYISYNFVRVKEKKGNGSYLDLNYFNASAITGYQFNFGKSIYFEVFGGIGYRKNFTREFDSRNKSRLTYDTEVLGPIKNLKVILQVNLGYAFF